MTVTIKDVARAAGVSIGTVSKVINKSGHVSDRAKERIHIAISLFGYRPNAIARSLKQARSNIIGVIVPDFSDFYMMNLMKSIENIATEMGYNLIVCSNKDDPEEEKRALQWLIERRVEGIVMIPTGHSLDEMGIPESIPIILVDRKIQNREYDIVVHESTNTSFLLIQHLYSHGFRKLLIIHGSFQDSSEKERYDGAITAINRLSLLMKDQKFLHIENNELDALIEKLIEYFRCNELPEGIFVTNRILLVALLHALSKLDIQISTDVGLVSFGNIDYYKLLRPSITSAIENPSEVGKISAEFLFERIYANEKTSKREILVQPEITFGSIMRL